MAHRKEGQEGVEKEGTTRDSVHECSSTLPE